MKLYIGGSISGIGTFVLTYFLLNMIWVFVEVTMYGEPRPKNEDTVMLFIFSLLYTAEALRGG